MGNRAHRPDRAADLFSELRVQWVVVKILESHTPGMLFQLDLYWLCEFVKFLSIVETQFLIYKMGQGDFPGD